MKTLRLLSAVLGLMAAGAASAAVDITRGTWFGTDGTDGTLRGRDALGNAVNLLTSGAPNPALKYLYDTQLDLTWLADGNAAAGSAFDDGDSWTEGRMTWNSATAWAASLTDSPLVVWNKPGSWALPSTDPSCGTNFNCTASMMGALYYTALGNPAGGPLLNTGPFRNLLAADYWTGTENAPFGSSQAWYFVASSGFQYAYGKYGNLYALPVRPGDVAAVPEASSLALLLVGLVAVGVVGARHSR